MALFQKNAILSSKTTQILLVIIGIWYLPVVFSAQIRNSVDSSATTTAAAEVIDISHSITKEYIPTANQGDCDVNQPRNGFMWLDYLILAGMLVGSCGIGLFYGFIGTKQTTSSDFLLGGSSMGTVPMAMSLAASFITAIELLGNPAEMYNHGTQFWMIIWAFVLVVPISSHLYLPVFMNLRLTSSFEYLALRFNSKTRLVAAVLYSLQMIMYTSVAVYAPALALSKVTGLNVYIAVSVVYIVCVFYASQGGMKAVIIADSFQAAILVGSILLILVLGEKMVGGTGVVWSNSYNTERLEIFNMDPNPTIRHSFWSVVIGGTSYWTTMYCANQSSIQKYLSVKTLSQARKALWITAFVLSLIYTINFYTGMIMVANWKDCDPLLAEEITASDQMLPYYVNTVMGHLSGMQGFFVAGIFAASLGTVAAALNSLAAITINDFMVGGLGINIPESKGALYAKWISLLFGILSFALVFVVEQLGSVMQIALSFNGMVGGVTLGLFSLGMFFPWCNSKGAITGAIVAMALVLWIGMGAQVKAATGEIVEDIKFVTAAGCSCLNQTDIPTPPEPHDNSDVSAIYRISYLWYSPIGIITTIVVGLVVSAFTGPRDPKEIDPDHMSPPFIKLYAVLPQSVKEFLNLPLKPQTQKNIVLKGVINHGLDVNEEKMAPTQNGTYKGEVNTVCDLTDEKPVQNEKSDCRKISTISKY